MDRINHATATPITKQFTNGNATTGVKPTVVTHTWLNGVQEELCNFIESRGIVLDENDNTLLTKALLNFSTIADKQVNVLNNQSNADLGGEFEFDLDVINSAVIDIDIYRKDSIQEKVATGKIYLIGKASAGTYELIPELRGDTDEIGTVFNLSLISGKKYKLQYNTSNFIGSSYIGKATYKIKTFKKV